MKRLREHAAATGQDMAVSEGGRHTRVSIGQFRSTAPRHREINDIPARATLRQLGAAK